MLLQINPERQDAEGYLDIDPEASSRKPYRLWHNSLSEKQKLALRIFRGGAVKTETRMKGKAVSVVCQFCNSPWQSMRHLWCECPEFESCRVAASYQYDVPRRFWSSAPRLTAKSGWIVYKANADAMRRSELLVVACSVGVEIILKLRIDKNWR